MPSLETYQLLLAAFAACEDKKAEDIRILALDPTESGLSDYFLICNGTNERQNVAITDEVEIRLKRDFGIYPNSVEGRRQGEWILMDYVDFIVHVFSAEKRQYYGLERLRKSAVSVSADDLNVELKAEIRATREKAGSSREKKAAAEASTASKRVPAKKKPGEGDKPETDALPAPPKRKAESTERRPAKKRSAKKTTTEAAK